MTITFNIRNVTSELVKTVMLRKFFQMVFVGNDKKSLHIYTATILGASNEGKQIVEFEKNENFISRLDDLRAFRMRFEFSVGSHDNNEVINISHEDITNTEHGFLNEIDCIRNVWGTSCTIILDNQNELHSKLLSLTGGKEEDIDATVTARLAKHKLLWTQQKKNGADDFYRKSLSVQGECKEVEEYHDPNARDGIAKRKAYAIGVPDDLELPAGVELVNWVRTTIEFKYPFDDSDLNYIIKKEVMGDVENQCEYLAPDFTWYFSPVVKSYINNRNSMVEIKRGVQGGYDTCICPIQKDKKIFYSSDKYQNSIDTVPNKLTVNFHYWTEVEKIKSRQKYRLAAKDVLPSPKAFGDVAEINLFIDLADEHNRGNFQFIMGIFLSFALAFGIDSTRLNAVDIFFGGLNQIFPADVWWISFLVLFTLTWMNKPAKLSEKLRKQMNFRNILLIGSSVWVFTVFGVCRMPLLEKIVSAFQPILGYITAGILFILIVSHIYYLCTSKVSGQESMWKELFGQDIL